jgi:hypothetical protein
MHDFAWYAFLAEEIMQGCAFWGGGGYAVA